MNSLAVPLGKRILFIDDHRLFSDGVRRALTELGDNLNVDWSDSVEHALEVRMPAANYDLVLLDLRLPGVSGLEAFRTLQARHPDVPIAVLSADVPASLVRQFIEEKAQGVMEKDLSGETLTSAVSLMLTGAIYVPPELMSRPRETKPVLESLGMMNDAGRGRLSEAGLCAKEIDVADALCRGLSNKEIARELGLVEGTVKVYVSKIYRCLGVNNRVRATLALQQ